MNSDPQAVVPAGDYSDLIELLDEEIQLYERMYGLLEEKQQAIVASDVEKLRECMQQEHPLIQATQQNAENLRDRVKNLKTDSDSETEEITLREIIKIAPRHQRRILDGQRQKLRAGLEQISKINHENRYLLNFSLEFTKGMVQTFLRLEDETAKLYNVNGHVSSSGKDSKIVNVRI